MVRRRRFTDTVAKHLMSVNFIYFDLGNVLLSFSHERMLRQIADLTGTDAERVKQVIQVPADGAQLSLQMQFESGHFDADDYFDRICQRLDARPERQAFFQAACDIFAVIEASAALVRGLHAAGNRLGVLSNTSMADWRFVASGRFPFLNDCFEQYALSFEAQSMKPNRRVYDYAVERTGRAAAEVFFTDDKRENVEAARAAGIDAVLFVDAATLREELAQRGVAGA